MKKLLTSLAMLATVASFNAQALIIPDNTPDPIPGSDENCLDLSNYHTYLFYKKYCTKNGKYYPYGHFECTYDICQAPIEP